ncbi:unnamed protein product [Linum trigynum]|uniref:Uncharacterized protein n=1 Tax=Linum trigynum TaxID=586398 RepID=A0AAV2FR21_9ROSI
MDEMFIQVEYCHLPPVCKSCGVFGHDCAAPCWVNVKKVWRKKTITTAVLASTSRSEEENVQVVEQVIESPPITPSTLPSQEDFILVVNGVKPYIQVISSPISLPNSLASICAKNTQLQDPPLILREGLRSQKGVLKAPLLKI